MAEKDVIETSEAEIAVHWGEEGYYHPSVEFIAQANLTDPEVYSRFSLDNFPNCFKEYADLLDHKEKADQSVGFAANEGQTVDKVLVWQRYPGKYSAPDSPMVEGRDYFVNSLLKDYYGARVDPEKMPAEDPLFLMYTSGTTGKPKGCQHSIGGYLAYTAGTSKYVQDIHPEDVYWCMADIGWITGHSYIVYGPLAIAASSVLYEGIPNYPDPGRPWRIARQLDVNIFHTAPTAIRALRKIGPDEPAKYNYKFKHMTTVGEPIEPKVWNWILKSMTLRVSSIAFLATSRIPTRVSANTLSF
jgi:acetyl-CoA synthetase